MRRTLGTQRLSTDQMTCVLGRESSQGPAQLGETAFPISKTGATIHSYLEMPHSHKGISRSLLKIFVTRICIYVPFLHPFLSQIK